MAGTRAPRDVDVYVSRRVRAARHARNMSQQQLAHLLGVAFQQVQKYEEGSNRISASRLHQIASIMELPMTFFFDGVKENGKIDPAMSRTSNFLATREGTLIAYAFPRLDKRTQQTIVDLVMAGSPHEGDVCDALI